MTTTTAITPAMTRRHVDISAALGWLAHGGELALALKGDKAKHSEVIWQLLVEAVEVIDKQPDQERRWLTSGQRSGGWNRIGMSRAELVEIEKIRMLSAMKPFDGQATYEPQRYNLERALGVLDWLAWCNAARQPDGLRKAAVALARDADREIVHRIYCPGRKPNPQNIREVKTRTIGYIQTGLKNDLGIVPGDGVRFVHQLARPAA